MDWKDAIEAQKYEQKRNAGGLAAVVWIISGIYLFVSAPRAHLLSLQALLFLVVGMFAAATVFGAALYAAQQGFGWVVMKLFSAPGPKLAVFLYLSGAALFVAQVAVTYLAARSAFETLTLPFF